MLSKNISKDEIEFWLRENDAARLEQLWNTANEIRKKEIGDAIYLRGLLEISNHCLRRCSYCGINRDCTETIRYRMSFREIMESVQDVIDADYGTVVIQAGEDYGLTRDFISEVIGEIRKRSPLAIALSLGERPMEDLIAWKQDGTDRYFLRFETSDEELYELIHPKLAVDEHPMQRLNMLKKIRSIGYDIGSGVMIGIPGQSYTSLANDIVLFRDLDLDMIGVGPYIRSPFTALGSGLVKPRELGRDQVPANELMTYKVIAIARIVCPSANITSTTALATIDNINGRILGFSRGANVCMPNVTPRCYKDKYTIYPNKQLDNNIEIIENEAKKLGRYMGKGRGTRKKSALSICGGDDNYVIL